MRAKAPRTALFFFQAFKSVEPGTLATVVFSGRKVRVRTEARSLQETRRDQEFDNGDHGIDRSTRERRGGPRCLTGFPGSRQRRTDLPLITEAVGLRSTR
jgi:hypothetical protein